MITIETESHAAKPKGAPFLIDQRPFPLKSNEDYEVVQLDEDKIQNWPMVYILSNKKYAYVGQTTSVSSRMSQHGANEEKKDFTSVSIIFNEEFNASVITDYEHRLINYMHGDGRYKLTNKNDGMTDTNYFSKAVYSEMFESLWEELRNLELAGQSMEDIEESEVFRYSPYKGLTADQRVALEKILSAVEGGLESPDPIVVEGMPGTGKTILAIYLLKMMKDDPRFSHLNVRLLEPVTSLRKTLQKALKSVAGLSADDIISTADLTKEKYGFRKGCKGFDVVLVDEAHRLRQRKNIVNYGTYDDSTAKLGLPKDATQLDWILAQVKLPVFFYDPLQAVGPSCLPAEHIEQRLGGALEKAISLDSQMRVKGGIAYLEYVMDILNGKNPTPRRFDGYDFVLHRDFGEFVRAFDSDLAEHDMSRMVAGYAWKWVSKKDSSLFDITIDDVGLRWNSTADNWVGKGFEDERFAHEVGCIHSIQGYDLSRSYVIIGEDIKLDPEKGLLYANKDGYFDRNGSATATPQELTQYIKNIYYVLMTRGIYGTHVYVVDPELRAYLAQFFAEIV